MSLFPVRRRQQRVATIDGPVIPPRGAGMGKGAVDVTDETALRHSALWAGLRLRAGLISSFPVDVYRKVEGIQVEMGKPPVLVAPGGEMWDLPDWMYASQVDLDRAGNTIGLITERNSLGLPARIDLQAISTCSVIKRAETGRVEYRIAGKLYDPQQVWHERQYVVAGLPVGLSPVAYAAWTIGESLSLQQFALDWFGGSGVPKARLRNTVKEKIEAKEAGVIRDRWRATVRNGDVFVHGKDWEYNLMQADEAGMEWLEGRRFGLSEIARFVDVPADLIDAAISAPGTITYQSALSRNIQFLIMSLQPAIQRREKNLSKLLPAPRYVKLNTNALLRMTPKEQAEVIHQRIEDRTLTPTEARALYDQPPLTPEQEAEFARLFGAPRTASDQPVARGDWWEQVSPMSAAPYTSSEVGK